MSLADKAASAADKAVTAVVGSAKDKDLTRDTVEPGDVMTTNQGLPISDDQNQLKAGVRGPSLLEDFHFREKITHFDHERIPERVVHARGVAAHGYFEAADSAADITMAGLFGKKGKRTPVFVRISTVAGSRGSADTPRDVRGFAIKFYTEQGVWDMVGNNIPIFFIQDAIKFPDLIHAVKPEPDKEIPQAASAHDTFYDFISLTPESTHMMMWVMSDRTLPRSLAMMEGFGIHTFRFINAKGESSFVKFHFKPKKGVHSFCWDESQKICGKDSDFHRRDLYESIERGDFPEWDFGVQVVPQADEHKFDFDLLDPTKIIPEELVPIRFLGKLVLDRNVDNFFDETEQSAFHPGHVVPGIDFSNDPLLQGRLFSYFDTQIKRVGPNFAQLPINRPTCPFSNNQRDGESQQLVHKGKVAYYPNSMASNCPVGENPDPTQAFVSYAEKMDGAKVRQRSDSFADHFSQATLFYNSMADWEKAHIVSAFSFELNQCTIKAIKQRVLDELLINVDEELAEKVAKNIGLSVKGTRRSKPHTKTSGALSMNKPCQDIKGRKVAILAGDGVDGDQVSALRSALKAQGALSEVIASKAGSIVDAKGKALHVDRPAPNSASVLYDAVYLPDGKHIDAMIDLGLAPGFVDEAAKHGKPIAASNRALNVLKAARVDTAGPGSKTGILTDNGGKSTTLVDDFIAMMKQHRFPARQTETRLA